MKKIGDVWKAEKNVRQCSLLWLFKVLPQLANTVDTAGKSYTNVTRACSSVWYFTLLVVPQEYYLCSCYFHFFGAYFITLSWGHKIILPGIWSVIWQKSTFSIRLIPLSEKSLLQDVMFPCCWCIPIIVFLDVILCSLVERYQ